MTRALRIWFLARPSREKILLLAFLAIGSLWWLSAFGQRLGAFWREYRTVTARLATQEQWLANQDRIARLAQETAGRFDPTRTLNGNQLVTTVVQLARDAGLTNTVSSRPETRQPGQFAVHSAEFNISRFEWEQLKRFYESLRQQAPYLSVERFILNAAPGAPSQLTLTLKVISVEIPR